MFLLRTRLITKRTFITTSSYFLERCNFPLYTSKYYFSQRSVNEHLENILKRKDKIPNEYKIVYRAPLLWYIKSSYIISLVSASALPMLLWSGTLFNDEKFPIMLNTYEIVKTPFELIIFTSGLLALFISTSKIVFSYPFRIYCNEETGQYIVIFQSIFPWRNVQEEFQAGELKKVEKSWAPWNDSVYKFKKRNVILMYTHFQRPIDLEHMMTPLSKEIENE